MGCIFSGNYYGADNSCCLFHRDGWHAKVVAAFEGWHDLAPIPDDIDPSYLKNLEIGETPQFDVAELKSGGFLEQMAVFKSKLDQISEL